MGWKNVSIPTADEGGRTTLFDTLSFTEGSPFSGANMLTEFELEMREEPEKGLWLTANWRQVRDGWRADAPADGIPAARRFRACRRIWRGCSRKRRKRAPKTATARSRKIGVTSMKRLGRFLKAVLKVTLGLFVWLFYAVFKWVMW